MSRHNGGNGPRTVALAGPFGSGKTTLLESILAATGAIARKGAVQQKNTVGDSSPEARARLMGVEVNCATAQYLGDSFTFLDCPGSIEFLQETLNLLPGIDAAIVVCESDPGKTQMLKPYLKHLADLHIPHFIFVNKIDRAEGSLQDLLANLQAASDTPLLLRQIPIWDKGLVSGFVDLALERAYVYREHQPSQSIPLTGEMLDREREARFQMLEKLADYDEHLMEELLSDIEPPRDEVYGDLCRELAAGIVVPVLIGSAEHDNGVRRLLKALRHEVPGVALTLARQGFVPDREAALQILKTYHSSHGGKLSLCRVLSGTVRDGSILFRPDGKELRVSGIFSLKGDTQTKLTEAHAGDTVAFGRLEGAATGDILAGTKALAKAAPLTVSLAPVYRLAVEAVDRKDEVKLTAAIAKLRDEDPGLHFSQDAQLQEMILAGQGEIHLKVAVEKLDSKYGLKLQTRVPRIPYRETIRSSASRRGRHRRQTGGHGQFGDAVITIAPAPRGSGFTFENKISGGAIPRQWIPSVEKGVREALKHGPLGFPVVDLTVTLIDGSFHSVDSSDAAFQAAGRLAMQDGLRDCAPVLLEPVMAVRIHVPGDATARVNAVVSARRGQLMGFDGRPGWTGWDTIDAQIPLAEIHDLIIDLRSLTQGLGTFEMAFDHLSELTGKLADQIVATHKTAA